MGLHGGGDDLEAVGEDGKHVEVVCGAEAKALSKRARMGNSHSATHAPWSVHMPGTTRPELRGAS